MSMVVLVGVVVDMVLPIREPNVGGISWPWLAKDIQLFI